MRTTIICLLLAFLLAAATFEAADDSPSPSADFLTCPLALKTALEMKKSGLTTIEFIQGVRGPKKWEKTNDTLWILSTWFRDPVTNIHKTYALSFQKSDGAVVLHKVTFDGHRLSDAELEDFTSQIIHNYETRMSVK